MKSVFKYLQRGFGPIVRTSQPVLVFSRPIIQQRLLFGLTVGLSGALINKAIRMDEQILEQPTIITENHTNCAMLVLSIAPQWAEGSKLTEVLSAVKGFSTISKELEADQKVEPDDEIVPLMIGVGFNTQLWQHLKKEPQPHHRERVGKWGTIPNSSGDIVLHIKGQTRSLCLEAVQTVLKKLPKGSVKVVHEQYGYKYRDGRDLSGFLDGTMNVTSPIQRHQNGIVQKTGGSYLMFQVWNHDLEFLDTVKVEEQEKWVGRAKHNSAELKTLDVSSHVRRMRDKDGKRLLIVRHSMPFGTITGEHGLLFIAYTNAVDRFDQMLDQMCGQVDEHNDSTMKYSKCSFSNYFYIPSVKEVQGL